jgi:hypothetical protein
VRFPAVTIYCVLGILEEWNIGIMAEGGIKVKANIPVIGILAFYTLFHNSTIPPFLRQREIRQGH